MPKPTASWQGLVSAILAAFDHAADHGISLHLMRVAWREKPSIQTIETFLIAGTSATGFWELRDRGLHRYTIEQIVMDHRKLFSKRAVTCAQWRLEAARRDLPMEVD